MNLTMHEQVVGNQGGDLVFSRSADATHKQVMASYLTHELRAPVTSIRLGLEILEEQISTRLASDEKHMLTLAIKNTNRLNGLVNDIMDYAKIMAGKMTVKRTSCEARQLVSEAVDSLHSWAISKGVRLVKEEGEPLPSIFAESGRIVQILTNLISNAIKFTPTGGKVTVSVKEGDGDHLGTMIFKVKDTGCGIPQKNLEKIFDAFQQSILHGKQGDGTGLGLTLAKSMVELHEGRIWAESRLGEGATFYFSVPITPEDLAMRTAFRHDFTDVLGPREVFAALALAIWFAARAYGADTTAPTVTITAPTNGATVGGLALVAASATDDNWVRKVEFYLDGILMHADDTEYFSWHFDAATHSNGQHKIAVKAYDPSGNVGLHDITVNFLTDTRSPSCFFTTPAGGATVSGVAQLAVSAADDVGVARVEFLIDDGLKETDFDAPYGFSWVTSAVPEGTHTVKARACDAAGSCGLCYVTLSLKNQLAEDISSTLPPTPAPPPAPLPPPTAPLPVPESPSAPAPQPYLAISPVHLIQGLPSSILVAAWIHDGSARIAIRTGMADFTLADGRRIHKTLIADPDTSPEVRIIELERTDVATSILSLKLSVQLVDGRIVEKEESLLALNRDEEILHSDGIEGAFVTCPSGARRFLANATSPVVRYLILQGLPGWEGVCTSEGYKRSLQVAISEYISEFRQGDGIFQGIKLLGEAIDTTGRAEKIFSSALKIQGVGQHIARVGVGSYRIVSDLPPKTAIQHIAAAARTGASYSTLALKFAAFFGVLDWTGDSFRLIQDLPLQWLYLSSLDVKKSMDLRLEILRMTADAEVKAAVQDWATSYLGAGLREKLPEIAAWLRKGKDIIDAAKKLKGAALSGELMLGPVGVFILLTDAGVEDLLRTTHHGRLAGAAVEIIRLIPTQGYKTPREARIAARMRSQLLYAYFENVRKANESILLTSGNRAEDLVSNTGYHRYLEDLRAREDSVLERLDEEETTIQEGRQLVEGSALTCQLHRGGVMKITDDPNLTIRLMPSGSTGQRWVEIRTRPLETQATAISTLATPLGQRGWSLERSWLITIKDSISGEPLIPEQPLNIRIPTEAGTDVQIASLNDGLPLGRLEGSFLVADLPGSVIQVGLWKKPHTGQTFRVFQSPSRGLSLKDVSWDEIWILDMNRRLVGHRDPLEDHNWEWNPTSSGLFFIVVQPNDGGPRATKTVFVGAK